MMFEIVRNVGVVLLQREIPDSINIHVVKAVKRAVVSVILTWEEWICQSLMKYWIQSTSCTRMKLSSVASPEDLLKLLNILAKSSQSVISWYLTESMVKPSSFHKCLHHEFRPRPSHLNVMHKDQD
ncbi:uncharacterized protein LOC106447935 [Brassica napus]|uniref:uncharacterized protein LOC106447935 n=1 Tax=Brassica napus TaxID=3708 RepID=UPI002078BF9C|nr:uncharacterized protein LOC106447935 [Brassica napus]